MKRGRHDLFWTFVTAIAIVFVSALLWLGIVELLGLVLPWPMNVALLVIAVFAVFMMIRN